MVDAGAWAGSGHNADAAMYLDVVLSVVLILSAICYALLAVRLVSAKNDVGNLATSLPVFAVGRLGHFVGSALVPVSLFVCFRDFVGYRTSSVALTAMLILPALSIIVFAAPLAPKENPGADTAVMLSAYTTS